METEPRDSDRARPVPIRRLSTLCLFPRHREGTAYCPAQKLLQLLPRQPEHRQLPRIAGPLPLRDRVIGEVRDSDTARGSTTWRLALLLAQSDQPGQKALEHDPGLGGVPL